MRYLFLLLLTTVIFGCSQQEKTLKIAATSVPHAEILEAIKPDLKKEGIYLRIVEIDDYILPNRLLDEKQVDANFFQHIPYLNEQVRQHGYHLTVLAKVHIEPLGIYSKHLTSMEEIPESAIVAIPSDPTNEARALDLLADQGLITLKPLKEGSLATIHDIESNPKKIVLEEIDAPFLPRTLPDVDLAVIPANFALQANLNPLKDALVLENPDSPYVNVVVIREGEENREDLKKLKKLLNSEKMRQFIREKYQGSIIPAF